MGVPRSQAYCWLVREPASPGPAREWGPSLDRPLSPALVGPRCGTHLAFSSASTPCSVRPGAQGALGPWRVQAVTGLTAVRGAQWALGRGTCRARSRLLACLPPSAWPDSPRHTVCQLCAVRRAHSRRLQAPRAGGTQGRWHPVDIPEDTRFRTDAVTLPLAQPGLAAWVTSLAGVAGTPGLRAESRWALGRGPQHLRVDPAEPCSCLPPKCQLQSEERPASHVTAVAPPRSRRGSPPRKMAGAVFSHCP